MKEIKDIIAAYDIASAKGKQTALATVVSVEGSSYRRPGARMLITQEGELTGAISGGCLEGDALRKALFVMSEQRPMVVTYDTTDEDDAKVGVGLGCNGIIRILIEPIKKDDGNNPVEMLKQVVKKRMAAVMITVFSFDKRLEKQPGTCLLYLDNERITASDHDLKTRFDDAAAAAFAKQLSFSTSFKEEEYEFTSLVEIIKPSTSLVIIGAGNDAFPLTAVAAIQAWDITVIDGRRNYATQQRFPQVQRVIVSKPETALDHITIDQQTVFILMTHNYNYDLAIFRQLLFKPVTYIGMLGPKKRLDRMLSELREEGLEITEQQLSKVYGPVGLDIGAETAEEIALSIISEIRAVQNNKTGHSLRTKQGAIHAPFLSQKSNSITDTN